MPKIDLEIGLVLSLGNYQTARVSFRVSEIDTSKPVQEQLAEVKDVFPELWSVVSKKLDDSFTNLENEYNLKIGGGK